MSEIKVNLSLTLLGRGMMSEQECSKNPKENYDHFRMEVRDAKGRNKKIINVAVRKPKTVKQNIRISKEAYDHWNDDRVCPEPKLLKVWGNYTSKERVRYYCGKIAEALGAIDFTFEILDD